MLFDKILNVDKHFILLISYIGWPMYRKYGHAYDAFKLALK